VLPDTDAYFLLTKRYDALLPDPVALQRWLDWLAAQGVGPREVLAFLLAAPGELYTGGTLHQVGLGGGQLHRPSPAAHDVWHPCPPGLLRQCCMPARLLTGPAYRSAPQAGQVVGWLRSLGIKQEFLWTRWVNGPGRA
jgi:hypothetical protein